MSERVSWFQDSAQYLIDFINGEVKTVPSKFDPIPMVKEVVRLVKPGLTTPVVEASENNCDVFSQDRQKIKQLLIGLVRLLSKNPTDG